MSERREERKDRRRSRGPLIGVLVVTIIALLGVIGLLSARALFGDEGNPPEEPTASATPTPSASKPLVREDLNVAVGEGGSDVSEFDPSVPIGYEPTCKGAVEAATNYLVALNYTKVSSGELTPEDYVALTHSLTTGDHQAEATAGAEESMDAITKMDSPLGTIRPDWGGFTLVECSEGKSASVEIVYAADYAGSGELYYESYVTDLTWADGDWKISGGRPGESPTPLPQEPRTEPDEEVYTLIGTHTQWENYVDPN